MTTPDMLPRSGISFTQEKLWSRIAAEPASGRFNVPYALQLTGPVDLRVLSFSLNEVVRRHESLRTTFVGLPGKAAPRVASELLVEIALVEVPTAAGAEINRLADEEAGRPFDLAQGPLVRATLFRLDREKHLLLLVAHQIVADPWSIAVLQRELALLYEAFSKGQPSPLSELPLPYGAFAAWQRRNMQGELLEKLLSYWRHQLEAPAVLTLPADRSRLPVPTFLGARLDFRLPETVSEALRRLSRLEGTTPFVALLAAFQLLLCRYCGQDDIAVGAPIANRDRAEFAGVIGPLSNTLVMRCDLGGNPTFRELLRRVREVAREALAHQELPFEVLVEDLGRRGNQVQAPLFQVMFELQELPDTAPAFPGLTVEPVPVGTVSARCDLTLSLVDDGRELKGGWEYRTDLFNESSVERMAGHFGVLLEAIVADPDRRLADLPLLTESECHRLLVEWNDTAKYFPLACLHELFEAQAGRTPDAVAVVFEGSQLSYRALNIKANQLAHRLRKLGLGPDLLAGVYMERSLEMVVALLGILKSGAAYLPLDPVYPVDRLVYMMELSRTPVILTQRRLAGAIPPSKAQLICLDEWGTLSGESAEQPRSGVSPENLAYVMFTSGSTGRPKGVEITHAGVCNRLLWAQDVYRYSASDRILQKTPFSFDVSLWEFFSPLIAGSTLVMARPEGHRDSRYLAEIIRDQQITAVHFVPSMLQLYLDEEGASAPSLRRVVCSGEALPRELMRKFHKLMTAELHNLYGPTEASVEVTSWDCSQELPCETVPIGRPIANIRLYVLDGNLQPVPVGVPGELHIGGVGVARGYLNQPELTAAKFIPDPFSALASARLYKTGDRVHYLPDGNIEFLGRLDNQVKIRGNRVEPAEIESVLERHPEIKEAVVLPRQDASGTIALVAYLVLEKGAVSCPNAVREFLGEKVPGYMVPSAFVYLESFPLTASGKVDRKSLPEPEILHAPEVAAGPDDRLPDALEQGLVQIWEELLKVRPIGIRDNFFDLGGHSLMAIRLFGLIESRFGTRFSPSVLYHAPTIAELAAVLKNGVKSDSTVKLVSIRPEGDRPPLFCIAPVNHSALCFREITKHLDSAQPVFGIEGNEQILHTPLEEAAADFARVMLNTTPQGPFCLVGYSAGGVIAFEAARQLREKGHQVEFLAMLDSNSPVQPKPFGILDRIHRFYRDKGHRIARLRDRVYKAAGYEPPLPEDVDEAELQQREFLARVTSWQLNYTPQPFSGRVVYFEAEHPPEERVTDEWKRFARELEIHPVAGDHTQMVTAAPLTRTIGTIIAAHLSRISQR